MIKIFGILTLLVILAIPSSSQDYLDGGYAGKYSGDIGQYFTDPIFTMKTGSGTPPAYSGAPVLKPVSPLGSSTGRTTIGRYSAINKPAEKTFSSTPAAKTFSSTPVAQNPITQIPATQSPASIPSARPIQADNSGMWTIQLSEGKVVYLDLHQSGTRLFGGGSITSGSASQVALASGTASGNSVTLDILPESGTELYALSLDIGRLNVPSQYTAFRFGALTGYGTATASKSP